MAVKDESQVDTSEDKLRRPIAVIVCLVSVVSLVLAQVRTVAVNPTTHKTTKADTPPKIDGIFPQNEWQEIRPRRCLTGSRFGRITSTHSTTNPRHLQPGIKLRSSYESKEYQDHRPQGICRNNPRRQTLRFEFKEENSRTVLTRVLASLFNSLIPSSIIGFLVFRGVKRFNVAG